MFLILFYFLNKMPIFLKWHLYQRLVGQALVVSEKAEVAWEILNWKTLATVTHCHRSIGMRRAKLLPSRVFDSIASRRLVGS
jgi:hypothetical protein